MKFNHLSALMLPFAMVSCFGGAVARKNERVMARFNIEKSVRVIHGGNAGENPSGKEIKAAWGEPDRSSPKGGDTVWTYHTKDGIAGVMPMYYLPLPLLFPSGKDGIDFYFREQAERPYQAIERTSGLRGGYYDSSERSFGKIDR